MEKIKKIVRKNQKLILRWIIIAIVVLAIIFGFRTYVKSVYQKELDKNDAQAAQMENDLKSSIEKSTKSAYELTVLGKKMLDSNQNYWGTIILESASKKDLKYRDAALLTGYAYLRMAQEITNDKSQMTNQIQNPNDKNDSTFSTSEAIQQFNNSALEFLLKAQAIDPIYPQTQQLLSIVYKNLGDERQSALATDKAKAFATNNSNEQH